MNDGNSRFALKVLAASLLLAFGASAYAVPKGGVVVAGGATIAGGGSTMTINQTSQNVAINWQSFSIGAGEGVQFVQPNRSSVALNRVLGSDPSSILGSLTANGKVFLVNPNGILFGQGAQVNVGGLVASTLNITDADFTAGRYKFAGAGNGAILNQGSIRADGGYVALLGANVSNQGTIVASLGTVALAAGRAITLDVAGDGLLSVAVNEGAVNALVHNGGLIRANGGQVVLTAQAAGTLLQTVVNNTGIIEAQTIENRNGTIKLLGDMQSGTVNVGGTLDASAPGGGNGGFIETSAANVRVANDVRITTAAPMGRTGTWLIDPQDFVIAPLGGNISGATLSAQLVNNSVTITTVAGPGPGAGDIFVNDAVSWTTAVPLVPTTLTLNGLRDVNVNQSITAVDGNLVICCGRDINVSVVAALTTTRGSILLAAGRDVNLLGAVTTTNGNFTACAGRDVDVFASITVTNGTVDPVRSLNLLRGLVLSAGNSGTGPGVANGTVNFSPISPATVTNAPTTIIYNPVSYSAPTDYSINIIGLAPTELMLVFPGAVGGPGGGTSATLSGFNTTAVSGNPLGVTLVAGPGSTANFETPGSDVVTFTGFSLGGPNAGDFSFATSCCGPIVGRTTGQITAAAFDAGSTGAGVPVVPFFGALGAAAPASLNVLGGGITMPPIQLAELAPEEARPLAATVATPPPPFIVPNPVPYYAPRRDRN